MLIINFKSSIQRELDRFFQTISRSDFNIREVTKGAFTQARAKLNPWAFERLNDVAANTFYDGAKYHTWHNMRVLATDGTRLVLPNHPSVIEEFGQQQFGPKADSPRSLAMASMPLRCFKPNHPRCPVGSICIQRTGFTDATHGQDKARRPSITGPGLSLFLVTIFIKSQWD